MSRITLFKGLLLAACLAVGPLASAADPSVDQVFKAANAGMFAGQALMHRVMDGSPASDPSRLAAKGAVDPTPQYDMGGDQFGVADASSCDDAGASLDGGGEWN